MGKRKVKDQWEDGGFIVESQLEDWPVYKVKCPTSDAQQKPKYQILHQNRLLLVTNEDASDIPGQAQAKATPTVSNATPEAFTAEVSLVEKLQPSLVTRQGGGPTYRVWLNGEFRMKPWTQMVLEAPANSFFFFIWNGCERLHVKIFVRVLRSSRVNLNNLNNTNVFCCV